MKTYSPFEISALFLVALSHVLFAISMAMWVMFLWGCKPSLTINIPTLVEKGEFACLLFDSALSGAFFLQHSGMIRRSFRRYLAKYVPTEYHGAIYTISSSIALLVALVFWQESSYIVISTPKNALFINLIHVSFVLAILCFLWALNALKSFDLCGTDPILRQSGA